MKNRFKTALFRLSCGKDKAESQSHNMTDKLSTRLTGRENEGQWP